MVQFHRAVPVDEDQRRRCRDAVKRLEQAVSLTPGNIEALNSLSMAYAAEGDTEKALATIDRALKLQPSPQIQKLLRERREQLRRR